MTYNIDVGFDEELTMELLRVRQRFIDNTGFCSPEALAALVIAYAIIRKEKIE